MGGLVQLFAGHPARIGGALVLLAAASVIAWYLGSPLFVRTFANEALPTAAPPLGSNPFPPGGLIAAPTPTPGGPRIVRSGELNFVDSLHHGKGPVRLVEVGTQRILRFDDVAISNAPDVHVYLSRETGGKWAEPTSLYLGALKATNGSFNYELPANADLASYRSVVVWCRAFSVLITWADLT